MPVNIISFDQIILRWLCLPLLQPNDKEQQELPKSEKEMRSAAVGLTVGVFLEPQPDCNNGNSQGTGMACAKHLKPLTLVYK